MANVYPTPRGYRSPRPGQSERRGPPGAGQPRRPPGRPPARPGRSLPRPGPFKPPASAPAMPRGFGGAASAMRGMGALGAAFGLGYAIGTLIFAAPWDGWDFNVPSGVNGPTGGECPVGQGPAMWGIGASTFCGPIPEPYSPTGQHYALSAGVDTWFFASQWPPGTIYPTNWTHGENRLYTRFPAQGDVNGPTAAPRYAYRPQINDPAWADALGVPIYLNPLASPMAGVGPIGVGPVAPPISRGKLDLPSPGVGAEGSSSGEPSNKPRPRPQPEPLPQRPGRGTKERKMRASAAVARLGQAYGAITESEDVLDALHSAIDEECGGKKARPVFDTSRRGRAADGKSWKWTRDGWVRAAGAYRPPSLTEKAAAVYRASGCIDLAKFWQEYIDNQAEDALFGTASKDDAEASRRGRVGKLRFGFQTGPAL